MYWTVYNMEPLAEVVTKHDKLFLHAWNDKRWEKYCIKDLVVCRV